jgi:Fe-S-cluster-containing dehydrogenase component
MKKYSFVIDVAKCENCNNCFLSCKDEHCGNDWPGYSRSQPLHGHRWMNIMTRERGEFPHVDVAYLPKPCQHCDDAPCIRAGEGAVVKRDDGIVLIDSEKARGRKNLVGSCPYGAIWWNDELQVAQKCTFCAHLLDSGWKQPRCVQSCPTGALSILHASDEELAAAVRDEGLEVLDSGGPATRPRCCYKNLYRFSTACIFGSIASMVDGQSECVSGATVRLFAAGKVVDEQTSDEFGDYKFDRLPVGSAEYELEIVYRDRIAARIKVDKKESLSLDTIWI